MVILTRASTAAGQHLRHIAPRTERHIGLEEILQCDFRKGKMMWKNDGKNLVVVATKQGEFAWATPTATAGEAFVAELSAVLHGR